MLTDPELARRLALALNALGKIEGRVVAMRDLVNRELGDDYFSEEFTVGLDQALAGVETNILACCDAIGVVEHEPVPPTDMG